MARGASRPRRIIIDCTATYRHDLAGGIQRVVRNLVNLAGTLSKELDVEIITVRHDPVLGFMPIDRLPTPAEATHEALFMRYIAEPVAEEPAAPCPVTAPTGPSLLKRSVRASLQSLGLLNRAHYVRHMLRQLAQAPRAADPVVPEPVAPEPVDVGVGDLLFFPDTSWDTPEVWERARKARRYGARIGAVVYDLIPLRFSETCDQGFVDLFRRWWSQARRQTDFVVCISQAVWSDVQDFEAEHGRPGDRSRALRGTSFRLGAGLEQSCDQIRVRPQVRELFAGEPMANPYLMAASFHLRKDHRTVLEAFNRRWAEGSNAQLVVVARKYRNHPQPLVEQIERHPELGRRLHWFYDMEDGELDFCYRRAAALVTASYAEGFNLPIVESISRGRPVLASDIPVHREVGGAHAAYFPPRDSAALADLIRRYEQGQLGDSLRPAADFRWPDWEQSGRELLEHAMELYDEGVPCVR